MLIIPKISRLSRSTNGSNKKRWKKDNSVQITFATFSDLSPLSFSLPISFSLPPLLFLSISFPTPFHPSASSSTPSVPFRSPTSSRKTKFIDEEREGGRAREGI